LPDAVPTRNRQKWLPEAAILLSRSVGLKVRKTSSGNISALRRGGDAVRKPNMGFRDLMTALQQDRQTG
jgi:hypothetical protein